MPRSAGSPGERWENESTGRRARDSTGRREYEATDELECPLCSNAYGRQDRLRVHLHTNHRKSEFVERYLAAPDRTDVA